MKKLILETTASSKGQTIIPKYLRDRLEIKRGTKISWHINSKDEVVMKKAPHNRGKLTWKQWLEKVKKLDGSIWEGVDPVEYTHRLWDGPAN